jgi:hypothetical protein
MSSSSSEYDDLPDANPILFEYKGVSIRESDYTSTHGWYSDTVLHFFQKHLMATVVQPAERDGTLGDLIEFMDPSVVSLFKDGVDAHDLDLELNVYRYVFAALNKNTDLELNQPEGEEEGVLALSTNRKRKRESTGGVTTTRKTRGSVKGKAERKGRVFKKGKGTKKGKGAKKVKGRKKGGEKNDADDISMGNGLHWSLLLIDVQAKVAYHYDDDQTNLDEAKAFVAKYDTAYETNLVIRPMSTPSNASGSDCGPIVQWLMMLLVLRIIKDGENMSMRVGGEVVRNYLAWKDRTIVWSLLQYYERMTFER